VLDEVRPALRPARSTREPLPTQTPSETVGRPQLFGDDADPARQQGPAEDLRAGANPGDRTGHLGARGTLARVPAPPRIASLRLSLILPSRSMSMTFTSISSPSFTSSWILLTRCSASWETWQRPSVPAKISTKAPKSMTRLTRPW
jgi:hypothetical protein